MMQKKIFGAIIGSLVLLVFGSIWFIRERNSPKAVAFQAAKGWLTCNWEMVYGVVDYGGEDFFRKVSKAEFVASMKDATSPELEQKRETFSCYVSDVGVGTPIVHGDVGRVPVFYTLKTVCTIGGVLWM